MNKQLVSVIIPVYNVRSYLEEALDSVIHQTYQEIEMIIIDDGSTDGSGEICDAYAAKDPRITVIHQVNQGLSAARNTGLDHAGGEVISFLDPDDAFHPQMIETMLQVMNTYEAGIVCCKAATFHTKGKMPAGELKGCQPVVYDRAGALRAIIENEISMHAWNKIYKRECFETIRYPIGHVYEDIDTAYQLFDRSDRIVSIDEQLVMHRKRMGSISYDNSLSGEKDRYRAYTHLLQFVENNAPAVFSEMHRQKINRIRLSGLLSIFARSGKDAWTYSEEIRKTAERIDMKQCKLQVRGEYFLFSHCPKALIIMHKPLKALKKQIRTIREIVKEGH